MRGLIVDVEALLIDRRWSPHDDAIAQSTVGATLWPKTKKHCAGVLSELCEVLETEEDGSEAQLSEPVQYQCLDCLALFDSPETWLEHRRTHSRSSTHSNTETVVRGRTPGTQE